MLYLLCNRLFCPQASLQVSQVFHLKHLKNLLSSEVLTVYCRKCGRVVCNSCSPHRITIPYQFIVQPPTEGDTSNPSSSRARPALDSAPVGSSFESLGGGERVRLCNPCVPDPNITPPQTTQFERPLTRRNTHSRSVSSASSFPQAILPPLAGRPSLDLSNIR
jgi:hypothetical protein